MFWVWIGLAPRHRVEIAMEKLGFNVDNVVRIAQQASSNARRKTAAPWREVRDRMKIVIASDHAGFELKEKSVNTLPALDMRCSMWGVQYRTLRLSGLCGYVWLALMQKAERGILICGSGVGVSIAANKMPEIRAAMCHDTYSAHQGVEHDDMNVLVLGARIIGYALAFDLVSSFLKCTFSVDEERFVRRLNKVKAIEARFMTNNWGSPAYSCHLLASLSSFTERTNSREWSATDEDHLQRSGIAVAYY